jgi:hypothetical protein
MAVGAVCFEDWHVRNRLPIWISRCCAKKEHMRSIILRTGWWLIGEAERRTVARRLQGTDVIGYVVQGSNTKWKIEGRTDEFDSATSAANELVKGLTAHPVSASGRIAQNK